MGRDGGHNVKTYRLTEQALIDIEEIQEYYLDCRPEFIAVLHSEFKAKFQKVARFPKLGIDSSHLRPGMRRVFVHDYVVYYRHERGLAEIVRVLHGARDIDSDFFDDTTP